MGIVPGEVYYFDFSLPKGKIILKIRDKYLTQNEKETLYNLTGADRLPVAEEEEVEIW
jgi:hypothetical protein